MNEKIDRRQELLVVNAPQQGDGREAREQLKDLVILNQHQESEVFIRQDFVDKGLQQKRRRQCQSVNNRRAQENDENLGPVRKNVGEEPLKNVHLVFSDLIKKRTNVKIHGSLGNDSPFESG